MSKLNKTELKKIVNGYFNNGVSLNDTMASLHNLGVDFSDLQKPSYLHDVGIEFGFVLSDEQLEKKIVKHIEGQKMGNFFDIKTLALSLAIPQLDDVQAFNAIVQAAKSTPTQTKKIAKYSKLLGDKKHGIVCNWILNNPELGLEELRVNDPLKGTVNADEYYTEAFSYIFWYENNYLPAKLANQA